MNVVIRTDASIDIGTGHVMRCLTLAQTLKARGATSRFICREHAGHLCERIEAAGFAVSRLPPLAAHAGHPSAASLHQSLRVQWESDARESRAALDRAGVSADLLVVDNYDLGESWERALRPVARRILVIDDLADRPHDCDVVLDPNLHDAPASRYSSLVGSSTRVFVGPQYALLRPEFDRVSPRTRDAGLKRILISFGGIDPSNEALKLVHALRALSPNAPRAVFVLGLINSNSGEIREAAAGVAHLELVGSTDSMAQLMAEADLGVGACGVTAWERCVLGLPALVVVNAENQRDDARILHSLGAVRNLGEAHATSVGRWAAEISRLQAEPGEQLESMSRAAAAVMQGRREAAREFEAALVQ